MRLTDLLTLAVTHRMEKRAGIALPLAVGASIPGVVEKAVERSRSTEKKLEDAIDKPFKTAALPPQLALPLAQMGQSFKKNVGGPASNAMFGLLNSKSIAGAGGAARDAITGNLGQIAGAPGKGIAQGLSDMVQKRLFGQDMGERKDMMGMAGTEAVKTFGKEMGSSGANLLRDIATKAMEAVGHAGDSSAREAILGELKRTDPVLAGADDKVLMESYHTMTRFAPVLSTDKNAVRSFLRQAVMSGTGPDFMSIKHLADSERAVTGGGDKRASLDLRALLSAAARPAAIGAGAGAITGAISDSDDRSGGALRGALTGGALGGLGGAIHGHMTAPHASAMQGPLPGGEGPHAGGYRTPGAVDIGTSNMGLPGSALVLDPASSGARWLPEGVRQTHLDLQNHGVADLGGIADATASARKRHPGLWR